MEAKAYDAKSLREQFEAQAKLNQTTGKTDYIKLSKGAVVLRHIPSDPLFVKIVKRTHKHDGKYQSFMDFRYLLAEPKLAEAALSAGAITGDDLALANEFGDPFGAIASRAGDLGVDDKQIRPLWARTRYLWNAINMSENKEQVALYESSKAYFDAIMTVFNGTLDDNDNVVEEPTDIFDPVKGFDVIIKGNGQDGMLRRYKDPVPAKKATKVGYDYGEQLIDLEAKAVRTVRPWKEAARCALAIHGELAAQVGITADTWGV